MATFFRFSIFLLFIKLCFAEEIPDATIRINRLSEQVAAVLEHYKSEDPMGLPGTPIPDPMPVPEMKKSLTLGTLILKDQSVYGLSKFKIENVYSNLADLEMSVAVKVDILQVLGNYTFRTWFQETKGASNITLVGLYAEGIAKLEVAREGNLEATDIDLDISVLDIEVYLENPGFIGSWIQGAMNSIGTLVFDGMKPYIMSQVNTNILGDVNKNLRTLKRTFPNSLSPLDSAFVEGKRFVRRMGYDPFKIKDFKHSTGILDLDVTHIWITGLSSFHRVGNITVSMENNIIRMEISVGTQQLKGSCDWEISMLNLANTLGRVAFTIEYIEVNAKVNQSLDVRNKPNLEDLDIVLGNFQLQFDGLGTLDYVLEAGVNILPNLLRHQIMLAIEEPLKIKVREIFSDIDVEKTIKEQVQAIEKLNEGGDFEEPATELPFSIVEEGLSIDESRLDESIF